MNLLPRLPKLFLMLTGCLLMSACAETRMVMELSNANLTNAKVWPSPPDKPRYRYVGELTGEENFHPEKLETQSAAAKLFDWLVGLSSSKQQPVVLQRPQSGVVDAEGRIYITDINRSAVYVFDKPAGKLDVWGVARGDLRFKAPIGIALGDQGDVLVADAELHTVFRMDKKGSSVGTFGEDDLIRPTGLARDAKRGLIYVSDTYAHNVKVFGDSGKLIKTIGQRGEQEGEFNFPTHLAFAGNKLYVTDTLNSRIQIFDVDGKFVKQLGQRGLYVGNLVRPKGVAVDSQDSIYVIESLYDQLLIFNNQGETLLAIGGEGKDVGQFYLPAGVWVDDNNYIYIADMFNGRVTVLQFLGDSQ